MQYGQWQCLRTANTSQVRHMTRPYGYMSRKMLHFYMYYKVRWLLYQFESNNKAAFWMYLLQSKSLIHTNLSIKLDTFLHWILSCHAIIIETSYEIVYVYIKMDLCTWYCRLKIENCKKDKFINQSSIHFFKLVFFYTGHIKSVECLAFSFDSTMLCSGSWDKTAIMWNVEVYYYLILNADT